MIIYPAIDLKDGHCVRLLKGEMGQATVFNDDPAAQARAFEAQGFEWLDCNDEQHSVLAFLRNGDEMSVRDKGPLWVVYPYDSTPEYQSELIYSRSVWQLARIEVQP